MVKRETKEEKMKNFLNVGVLFVVGAMPAVSVASFLRQMLCLLTVRLSGGKVLYFKYLCLDYRQENGEGKMRMGQFSPVCQFLYTNGDREYDQKEDIIREAVRLLLYFVAGGLIEFILYRLWRETGAGTAWLKPVIAGIAAGFILEFIGGFRVLLYKLRNDGKNLTAYWRETLRQLSQGTPLEEVWMPPYQELYSNVPEEEILLYDGIRFMQKLWQRDYETLKEVAVECDWIIRHWEYQYIRVLTNVYYNMIFYYSCIERSPERADRYYQAVRRDLEQDMDSNGRRVMAYYTYFCKGQPQEAMKLLQDGQKVLNRLSTNSFETELERRLLGELEQIILQNQGI